MPLRRPLLADDPDGSGDEAAAGAGVVPAWAGPQRRSRSSKRRTSWGAGHHGGSAPMCWRSATLMTRRYDDARRAFAAQYGFPPDSAAGAPAAGAAAAASGVCSGGTGRRHARRWNSIRLTCRWRTYCWARWRSRVSTWTRRCTEFEQERAAGPAVWRAFMTVWGMRTRRRGDLVQAQQSLQRALLLEPSDDGSLHSVG